MPGSLPSMTLIGTGEKALKSPVSTLHAAHRSTTAPTMSCCPPQHCNLGYVLAAPPPALPPSSSPSMSMAVPPSPPVVLEASSLRVVPVIRRWKFGRFGRVLPHGGRALGGRRRVGKTLLCAG